MSVRRGIDLGEGGPKNVEMHPRPHKFLIGDHQGSVLVYMLLGTPPPSKSCNRILLYRSFHKEVRLGGWGSEGPTLGRHASVCATILRLRALLYLRASH